ncbi:hypothetical protein CH63R_04018 [Colletotrichum higginsianum IMI 349063]|uniref:Uncharacterized protein n=1 Tax=Colletotrichum higginsianum (strain IMI 349063) TaxID=759273 RepID=A0A1B7YIC6_COLHI|nr:hypothetical protein CH63R_04018 [Colletotrichum higginsianum IMI 349063]OBR11722.1 hypothetical protein CH63R_04018 [Colletotrichum higginsianum IMI 349063]
MAEEGVIETWLPDIVVLSVALPHFPLTATVPDKLNGPLLDRAKQTRRLVRTLDIGMFRAAPCPRPHLKHQPNVRLAQDVAQERERTRPPAFFPIDLPSSCRRKNHSRAETTEE